MSKSEEVLFHDGCKGCPRAGSKRTVKCVGCCFFRFNWSRPNLNDETARVENLIESRKTMLEAMVREGVG